MDPDISVCVPVYQRHRPPNLMTFAADLDVACDGMRYELIVVLNGLSLGAAETPSGSRILRFATNRGVPVAWNTAAREASGRLLVFANDDVRLGRGALSLLARTLAETPNAGVVGPVGTRWDLSSPRHIAYVRGRGTAGSVEACDVVSGFLFATPAEVHRRVGGFDERLTPCSFEEVDYCTAVRLQLGLRCFQVDGVEYEHDFGISAKRRWRRVRYDGRSESLGSINRRNRELFRSKWSDRVPRVSA